MKALTVLALGVVGLKAATWVSAHRASTPPYPQRKPTAVRAINTGAALRTQEIAMELIGVRRSFDVAPFTYRPYAVPDPRSQSPCTQSHT